MTTTPDPAEGGSRLPLGYLVDFLELLAANRDRVSVITYDDLAWGRDYNYADSYPRERRAWNRRVARKHPDRIFVLLQHDVDSWPERTVDLLRHEERLGLPSNIMVFNRRHDRKQLRSARVIEYTPYDIQPAYLQRLERERGFVVGYHSNAVEQSLWDLDAAQHRFQDDLRALRKEFSIRYFSPHGGVPGPNDENNKDIRLPPAVTRSVRWVHNGHTARFDGVYSDGGINNPKRNIEERDLRDFVRTWEPGRRYRVLVHPQYYSAAAAPAENLSHAAWYLEVHEIYAGEHPDRSAWDDVVGWAQTPARS